MNFLCVSIITVVALVAVHAVPVDEVDELARLSTSTVEDLASKLSAAGGCVNANVCFAIDGSGSLNRPEFEAEKNFVLDVISIIAAGTPPVGLAAVQYSTVTSTISPLTTDNIRFTQLLTAERAEGGATFLTGGINFCFAELFQRQGQALKMVVLGDGFGNIGSSAIDRARLFRDTLNGEVCVVGAGVTNDSGLLAIAGDNPGNVFQVGNFLNVLELNSIVKGLVEGICDISFS